MKTASAKLLALGWVDFNIQNLINKLEAAGTFILLALKAASTREILKTKTPMSFYRIKNYNLGKCSSKIKTNENVKKSSVGGVY